MMKKEKGLRKSAIVLRIGCYSWRIWNTILYIIIQKNR